MFTIIPYGRGRIPCESDGEAAELLAAVSAESQLCDPADRPSVQLSHAEIPEEDVEAILDYAGITVANAPVGLPCDFEPRKSGRDCLFFPLSGLESHLRRTQPEVIAEYERHSSFEQFLGSRDMLAREYLVAGLIECIKWCYQQRAALTIRW